MDKLQVLEAENDMLRERIYALEESLGYHWIAPLEFHLTGSENALLGALMAKPVATKEMIYNALYGLHDEPPGQKIIDVYVCKIRTKLKPWNIPIETLWGRGYMLSPESKARINAMLEAHNGRPQADPDAHAGA